MSALPTCVVSLAGIAFAVAWVHGRLGSGLTPVVFALALMGVGIVLGYLLTFAGRAQLPNYPIAATRLMEWWWLVPLSLGAGTVAGATVVILWLASTSESELDKTIAAQLSAVLTVATTAVLAWLGSGDGTATATRIRAAFQDKYRRPEDGVARVGGIKYVKAGSRIDRLVNSAHVEALEGWGYGARIERARRIAGELKAGTSDA